jgi:hypothetical protein
VVRVTVGDIMSAMALISGSLIFSSETSGLNFLNFNRALASIKEQVAKRGYFKLVGITILNCGLFIFCV